MMKNLTQNFTVVVLLKSTLTAWNKKSTDNPQKDLNGIRVVDILPSIFRDWDIPNPCLTLDLVFLANGTANDEEPFNGVITPKSYFRETMIELDANQFRIN